MGTLGRRRTSCGHSCAGTWMLLTLCLSHGGLSPRSQEVFGSEKIQTKQLISHVRKLTTQGHETNSGPSPPPLTQEPPHSHAASRGTWLFRLVRHLMEALSCPTSRSAALRRDEALGVRYGIRVSVWWSSPQTCPEPSSRAGLFDNRGSSPSLLPKAWHTHPNFTNMASSHPPPPGDAGATAGHWWDLPCLPHMPTQFRVIRGAGSQDPRKPGSQSLGLSWGAGGGPG